MKQKLMMIGFGDLAWHTLEILLRTPGFPEHVDVLTCDPNAELGLRRTNSALLSATSTHHAARVRFEAIDVFNIEQTAEKISRFQPNVIFDCTSLQSWYVITTLPEAHYKAIDQARYAPWIPMHCAPTLHIMKAVKQTGLDIMVINSGFPDVTNCALGKIGLAPHVGIGNIDNVGLPVKMYIAEKENVPLASVQLYMYYAHFLSYYVARFNETAGSPFILKVFVDGHDLSEKYEKTDTLKEATIQYRRQGGLNGHTVVGASCAKNVLHTLRDSRELTHSPGPCGLPGGYTVRIGSERVEVALPPGLTLEDVVEINKRSNQFDGIEDILDDGTIVMTEPSYQVMKALIGYDCKSLNVQEAAHWAKELDAKFKAWTARVA